MFWHAFPTQAVKTVEAHGQKRKATEQAPKRSDSENDEQVATQEAAELEDGGVEQQVAQAEKVERDGVKKGGGKPKAKMGTQAESKATPKVRNQTPEQPVTQQMAPHITDCLVPWHMKKPAVPRDLCWGLQ